MICKMLNGINCIGVAWHGITIYAASVSLLPGTSVLHIFHIKGSYE